MTRKSLYWLVSIGALVILILVRYALPGSIPMFLATLTAASLGLVLFAGPLGPVSCRLEEKLIDRVRLKATEVMGRGIDGQWGRVLFKPVFTSPDFAAKILRFMGVVICLFAVSQMYLSMTSVA